MTLLNCDMGESFGIWRLGDDRRIMPAHPHRQCRLRLSRLRFQPHARDRSARQGHKASRSAHIRPCPIGRASAVAK